jgi:hypothetical protein
MECTVPRDVSASTRLLAQFLWSLFPPNSSYRCLSQAAISVSCIPPLPLSVKSSTTSNIFLLSLSYSPSPLSIITRHKDARVCCMLIWVLTPVGEEGNRVKAQVSTTCVPYVLVTFTFLPAGRGTAMPWRAGIVIFPITSNL